MVSKKKNPLRIHYSYEGGIEKYIPHDQRLSSLRKPRDANGRSSRRIFLFHPHTHYWILKMLCPGGRAEACAELKSCLAVVCASNIDCNPVSISLRSQLPLTGWSPDTINEKDYTDAYYNHCFYDTGSH